MVELDGGRDGWIIPDSLRSATDSLDSDILSWALKTDSINSKFLSKSLSSLFTLAEESGRIKITSLADLDPGWFVVRENPRPAGYAAQTRMYFGGKAIPMLLDGGATSSALPEEVACMLIEYVLEETESGRLGEDSRLYPIVRMETYVNPSRVKGVGSDSAMETIHALVLRAEFVLANGESGAWNPKAEHPIRDITFKILPKGCADIKGGAHWIPGPGCPEVWTRASSV